MSKDKTIAEMEQKLRAKRAELAKVAPAGSAWGGIQHDRPPGPTSYPGKVHTRRLRAYLGSK